MTTLLAAPSPSQLRTELLQAVLLDLLGPAAGSEEELDERNVRDRYLVGMLAPKRQELSPEEFDELAQGGVGSAEDGATDFSAPPAKTMFPSSFGMTFCVDKDAEAIRITALWGHYLREKSETLTKVSGDPKLIWKRYPRGGISKPVSLQAGRFNWKPVPDMPEVYVQGLIRKRDDHWSVTLFLVNGQEEPKKLRDQAWLFQPELAVECPQRKPIFFRRASKRDPGKIDPRHLRRGAGDGDALPALRRVRGRPRSQRPGRGVPLALRPGGADSYPGGAAVRVAEGHAPHRGRTPDARWRYPRHEGFVADGYADPRGEHRTARLCLQGLVGAPTGSAG